MTRALAVTDTDVALLRTIARARSVVAASREVGISRDRATYRLSRLRRAFGGAIVESARGGRDHGGTRLTPLGDRIVRGGFDSIELVDARPLAAPTPSNSLVGTYRRQPAPRVELGGGASLRVAFAAEDGSRVRVLLDPESVLLAPARFASSARNVLPGIVEGPPGPAGAFGTSLTVRVGRVRLRASVTPEAIRQLRLRRGSRVWLYIKATALRRVALGTRSSR